jgi:hypothetical protein
MTRHLTPEQFVDALDASLPAEHQAHLAVCTDCANELAEMRLMMGDVTLAGHVPEPSPLFWNHLSARVREAVNAEPMPTGWWRSSWRPVLVLSGLIGVVLALVIVARATRVDPEMMAAVPPPASAIERTGLAESDPFWEMITVVAPTMPFDDVRAAGMAPGRAATDAVIDSLTPEQRAELMRLLRADMGASE